MEDSAGHTTVASEALEASVDLDLAAIRTVAMVAMAATAATAGRTSGS